MLCGGSVTELKNRSDSSIRIQLLRSLLAPLCLLCLVSTIVAYFLAVNFSNESYDHALINSAKSVAARLRFDGTNVWADMPPAAQAILHHKDKNKNQFYYQVLSKDGRRISGDAMIPGPFVNLGKIEPAFRNRDVNGKPSRIARIRVDIPNYQHKTVFVQVAETLDSRNELAQNILLSIIIPQLILIILGGFAVNKAVSQGLQPLDSLRQALTDRSRHDLSSFEEGGIPAELKPLVTTINALLVQLRSEIDAQKRFVANAAHQFRTPLAGLKTYIYYAKRLASDESTEADTSARNSQFQAVLEQINSGTDRMTHLANKLLALAKADPAIRQENVVPLDMNVLSAEITADLVGPATKKGLELEFLGADQPARIKGDSASLRELAENLIENAILYSETGGKILVSVVVNSGHILLAVQDQGPGISAEDRLRVFDRFYRVLGCDVPGSGLGLAIVKEIATSHNAEVQITSGASGRGTTVVVTFPALSLNAAPLTVAGEDKLN